MSDYWFTLWLNPEPWAVGAISGKRISPNPNLVAFQNAVREALEGEPMLPDDVTKITFYFMRQRAKYIDMADRIRQRNQADATNMQKGLEDALQGILFDNDRDVRDIRSVILEQDAHTEPCIVIHASKFDVVDAFSELPTDLLQEILAGPPEPKADRWQSGEDLF